MNRVMGTIIGGAVALMALYLLLSYLDPATAAEREQRRVAAQQESAELAPYVLALKKVVIGVVCVGLAAAAFAGVGLSWYGVKAARYRAHLVHPKNGLLPAVLREVREGRGLMPVASTTTLLLEAANRNPMAETMQALVTGNVTRLPNAVGRAIEPREPEVEPPALAGPVLPERVEVYDARASAGSLALGVGERGPVEIPLDDAGHLLVAGSPRRGKSNLLAAMTVSLARWDPTGERVQVALCDLKNVDFAGFGQPALLMRPVAFSIAEALATLAAVEQEMERRYKLMQGAGVRHIEAYNGLGRGRLPYLVEIVDEIADLSANPDRAVRDEFGQRIGSVGRKGGAAGIVQVLATQRPSADVLPRHVTGICDTRIAFRTATRIESQLILDDGAAAELPIETKGRAVLKRDGLIVFQAYDTGLRKGRFAAFMAGLPQAAPASQAAPSWVSTPEEPAEPEEEGDTGDTTTTGDIDGACQTVEAPAAGGSNGNHNGNGSNGNGNGHTTWDEERLRIAYEAWRRTGVIRQAQAAAFGYEGGTDFYTTKAMINEALRRRGDRPLNGGEQAPE